MHSGARRSTYRSLRSVPPPNSPRRLAYVGVVGIMIVVLLTCALLPAAWLDYDALYDMKMTDEPHGLGAIVSQHNEAAQKHVEATTTRKKATPVDDVLNRKTPPELEKDPEKEDDEKDDDYEEEAATDDKDESEDKDEEDKDEEEDKEKDEEEDKEDEDEEDKDAEDKDDEDKDDEEEEDDNVLNVMKRKVKLKLPKIIRDRPSHLDRGVSGLPMSETPALIGAKRGYVQECDVNVNSLAYWNDPQGDFDANFDRGAPFHATGSKRYLTFEPDTGGWNNVRMSLENIFVFCAATGRTLVLPPPYQMYLLGQGAKSEHGFGDFFPIDKLQFQKHCPIMTMEEFIRKEGGIKTKDHTPLISIDEKSHAIAVKASQRCEMKIKSKHSCQILYQQLRNAALIPSLESTKSCLIFDEEAIEHGNKTFVGDKLDHVKRFCGVQREFMYYDKSLRDAPLIHFMAGSTKTRLLNHFYATILFTDPVIDNHFKRFVRDFLHYRDSIFCAAGKIIFALQEEAIKRGFTVDEEGGSGFSALHIRRGDFQFTPVKIPAEEWYENTKDIWLPKEILYIATDERDKAWFEPLAKHHELRFLDDYWDFAHLGDLDPNYMGMIETVVASRGRAFAGTWFSTFSGYINRMRGYHGMSTSTSWYSFLTRKTFVHNWTYPNGNYYAREFPIGWVGIDGNIVVEHERESVSPVISLLDEKDNKESKKNAVPLDNGPLARGVAGLPMVKTPALIGAKRGNIECSVDVNDLAYWNDPQGERDIGFQSPFAEEEGNTKYLSFEPDSGGWNNIRMSLESIFILAAAMGRTLVMPPEQHLYLLNAHDDKGRKARSFGDFFALQNPELLKKVPIITTEEFLKREGGENGLFPMPNENRTKLLNVQDSCEYRMKGEKSCFTLYFYLRAAGLVPDLQSDKNCIIFDQDRFAGNSMSPEHAENAEQFCGKREMFFIDKELQDHDLIHLQSSESAYRLLNHFYGFIHFTDSSIGNYYKRFVRDFMRYNSKIYCAAGKIVRALEEETKKMGHEGFSSLHVRRGDFQYKEVKLPAEKWYENTKDIWKPKELLFIATDEKNKTFFDPIKEHHEVRFLDDYWDAAGLGDLDPNYMGMIDTIVASRGRAFAGTWFSTFTGYINRMRGYHGISMQDVWYGWEKRKTRAHIWPTVTTSVYAFEWPDGWVGIDGDLVPSRDKF